MSFAVGQTERKSRPEARVVGGSTVTLPKRIWDKIIVTDGCWIWTGANTGGRMQYGITWNSSLRRREKVHRYVYEAVKGLIPDGLVIDHICKNTLCCNPKHLRVVTNRTNILIGDAPGPRAVRTNHCKYGHEFTPENTYWKRDGTGRDCRTCIRRRHREEKQRIKERRTENA